MADPEDEAAEAVQRLQAALERIAAAGARRGGQTGADPAKAELAARLDAIIAQLRTALDGAADSQTTESR